MDSVDSNFVCALWPLQMGFILPLDPFIASLNLLDKFSADMGHSVTSMELTPSSLSLSFFHQVPKEAVETLRGRQYLSG